MNRWLIVALVCGGCQQAPHTHEVAIRDFVFDPDTLRIAVGDTVIWRNHDFAPHTATATSKSWDSNTIAADQSWSSATFRAGRYQYLCALHPNMRGMLVVE